MNVIYNCFTAETRFTADRGYRFLRGDDAFLMWSGYFDNLMDVMFEVYRYEPDPNNPQHRNIDLVPLLRAELEEGWIGTDGPVTIMELANTVRALSDAIARLGQTTPCLPESPQHGQALVKFLNKAIIMELPATIEEIW